MPRMEALMPGVDPIREPAPAPSGPTLRGCLFRIGIVAAVIIAGLGLILNALPKGQKVVIWLTDTPSPFLSATPGDFTRTPTPSVLPTDTKMPTATNRPTTTGTPTVTPLWTGCRTDTCRLVVGAPGYDATYAMSIYRTAVAPLTPSSTPTITRTPTRRPTDRPGPNRIGASGGGASSLGNPIQQLAQTAVRYETGMPPIPATEAPTFPPQPNCSGGVIGILSADPNATPYQITTTPIPECVGRVAPATPAVSASPTRDQTTPQFLGTEVPTAAPTVELMQ